MTVPLTAREGGRGASQPRDRLCLALDTAELDRAVTLARSLRPFFAVAKVGLELFASVGPAAVRALGEEGFEVFLDLKMHDIPTTVGRAARAAADAGARYLTVHAAGGAEMLRAAVGGFAEQRGEAGILAVTVLTSEPAAGRTELVRRTSLARQAGCAGIVCAATDLALLSGERGALKAVVPGIRLAGASRDDQARVGTPAQAVSDGADLLVIGRTVTAAKDPAEAATAVLCEVAAALG